jgi:hypothetical protein
MGPTTILVESSERILDVAAALTVRYSDAPSGVSVRLSFKLDTVRDLVSKAIPVNEVEAYRI